MAAEIAKGAREHFGQGRLALDPDRSVFINCPFDAEYGPTFDAIVFSVACCGFIPRSALETGDVAVPRMERIVRAIYSSYYSIHDLSRCRGEGDERLARFNMPLELGMAMARRFGPGGKTKHDWFALVPEGHLYAGFISDLAGFDPGRYDGRPESVVAPVVSWLATRPTNKQALEPAKVLAAVPGFAERKERLQTDWGGRAPWADVVVAALDTAPRL
jgi:hypothetical protein